MVELPIEPSSIFDERSAVMYSWVVLGSAITQLARTPPMRIEESVWGKVDYLYRTDIYIEKIF